MLIWFRKPNIGKLEAAADVNRLTACLRDRRLDVRFKAVRALGRLEDSRAIEPLAAMLVHGLDEPPALRIEVVRALGKIGSPGIVVPLLDVLKLNRMITGAGKYSLPEDRPAQVDMLKDEIGEALTGMVGHIPDAVLVAALEDLCADVREMAAQLLGEKRAAHLARHLLVAVSDRDPQVRGAAVTALAGLSFDLADIPEEDASKIIPHLMELLKRKGASWPWQDSASRDRANAVSVLGKLGHSSALDALADRLSDDNPKVRKKAVVALGEIADPRATRPLLSAFFREARPDAQKLIAAALDKCDRDWRKTEDAQEAISDVVTESEDRSAPQQLDTAAFRAVAEVNYEVALRTLIGYLRDPTWDRRRDASKALQEIDPHWAAGPIACEALGQFISGLKDESWEARSRAAWALGKFRNKSAVASLLCALIDDSKKVREDAACAIAQVDARWAEGAMARRFIPTLIVTLRRDRGCLRKRGIRLLTKITGENFGCDHQKWTDWWTEHEEDLMESR